MQFTYFVMELHSSDSQCLNDSVVVAINSLVEKKIIKEWWLKFVVSYSKLLYDFRRLKTIFVIFELNHLSSYQYFSWNVYFVLIQFWNNIRVDKLWQIFFLFILQVHYNIIKSKTFNFMKNCHCHHLESHLSNDNSLWRPSCDQDSCGVLWVMWQWGMRL